ncbi:MAG: MiaB/RimO family radical SAM methylthiotransferase [Candidatus Aminicenantes bacterium]|nr:MiaB/RimO family radical SAM methylthiotransferase [Candidatus Aminicenantes bacterium]
MPSVAVRTFGCRVNQAEAFAWADDLRARGLELEPDCGRSDLVLINSCTLTGRADRDVRKLIRTIGRESPGTGVVVAGCYAERAPGELEGLPNVVAVLPASAKGRVADAVTGIAKAGRSRGRDRTERPGPGARTSPDSADDAPFRARATLKVQDGCDNRCAFCVVPGVRGRSSSVPPEEVAAAAGRLSERGYREIVLAGIHLASYGRDLEPRRSLLDLLRGIGAGRARLRLSSLDPNLVDDTLAGHLGRDGKICRHFHFSLQHASGRVLRSMGRPGDAGSSGRILAELRRLAPDAALGADVIVGFPGETDGDFEELRGFLDASPLTYLRVFPYSPRPGTPAWSRPRVADGVVTARARALRRLSSMKDLRFRRRFLGRELEAVVIGRSRRGTGVLTDNGIAVDVPFAPGRRRDLVRVRIGRVLPLRTEGEVVG